MRRKVEPLLCELHAHTRWSDGELTLPELVDLYGRNGFDVLAITDHVVRSDDPWRPPHAPPLGLRRETFADYLAEIAAQAERARLEYDLLLLPGFELTYSDGTSSSAGSPSSASQPSPAATSTSSRTSTAGRRSCPARRSSETSSPISARAARRS
jgi:PHP domain-containing protein